MGGHVKPNTSTLFYSCAFLSIFVASEGQAMEKRNVGVRMGPSYSQVDMSLYGKSQWQTDFAIGPFISTAVSENTSLDLSAIYTVRSGGYNSVRRNQDESNVEVDRANLSMDYIDLSILLRHAVLRQPTFAPVLIGGLSYGVITSTEYVQDGYTYPDGAKHADAAVVVGVGAERIVKGPNLSVDLVYRHPFVVSKWDKTEARGFSLLFGIGF
jgi:hypothetical protein